MKKGISIWTIPGRSYDEAFALAKAAGFDGVEVALEENASKGELNLDSQKSDVMKTKSLAEKNGIELYSVATGLFWKFPLTSNDPEIAKKAESVVRMQLDIASWLGCDTILVVPGSVTADVSYAAAYERALAAIKRTVKYAEEVGVNIGIENVWNKFLLSPLEMRGFIDAVGSPRAAAYFDAGNVLAFGYPQHWIEILGSRIKKVHIKDYRCAVGTLPGFVDLLSGDVDFPAVMAALRKIGYDGWITAEMSAYKYDRDQAVWSASGAMDKIFGNKLT